MAKYKIYKGKKYRLHRNRWERGFSPTILLAYEVWNECYPNDSIKDGEVIHHRNKNSMDDRIENLEKLTNSEHTTLHNLNGDLCYKGGIASGKNLKKWHRNYRISYFRYKQLFSFQPELNIQYYDKICFNLKTKHITITHGWTHK